MRYALSSSSSLSSMFFLLRPYHNYEKMPQMDKTFQMAPWVAQPRTAEEGKCFVA